MNKKKLLYVLEATALDLKNDLKIYTDEEDDKGINYTRGRLDGLMQVVQFVRAGKFD